MIGSVLQNKNNIFLLSSDSSVSDANTSNIVPDASVSESLSVVSTTSKPTTSKPTTLKPFKPTTSKPTTSKPTTSKPTTSIPTTSVPTTSIPTTSKPTTSKPTTSKPTTSSPTSPVSTTLSPCFLIVQNYSAGLSEARNLPVVAVVGNLILAAGGSITASFGSKTVDIFNSTTGIWSSTSLTTGRYNAAAASVSGIYYVIAGGAVSNQIYTSSAEVYNTVTHQWTYFKSALASICYGLASTSFGPLAVFAGGRSLLEIISKATLFNATSFAWSYIGSLTVARMYLGSATINSIGYFIGGLTSTGYSSVVDTYSFTTGVNSTLSVGLSQPRGFCSVVVAGSQLLVAGGYGTAGYFSVIDIYNTASRLWTKAQLSVARARLAGSMIGSKAIFAGGDTGNGFTSVIDIYDVVAQTLTTSALTSSREYAASASIGSLMVVMGGYSSSGFLNTVNYLTCSSTPVNSIPAIVDWRNPTSRLPNGAVTPVKQSGFCGGVSVFASTAALESAHAIATGKLVSLSEQQLIDCSSSLHLGCNHVYAEQIFDYVINNHGVCNETAYPYTGSSGQCAAANCLPVATISSYIFVQSNNETALQAAVALRPVVVDIANESDVFQNYVSGVLNDASCGQGPRQSMLVVGYNTLASPPYWIVRNSLGVGWGESGYIRIAMGVPADNQCGITSLALYPVV